MSSKKENALSKVQDLYLMQMALWSFLDDTEKNVEKYQSAQKTLREFKALLKEVDWQYMGGEDVLASLQWIPQEVNQYRVPYKPEVVRKRFQKRGGYVKTKPSVALRYLQEFVPDWIPSGKGEAPALETKVPVMQKILRDYGW